MPLPAPLVVLIAILAWLVAPLAGFAAEPESSSIAVRSPKAIRVASLPAERTALGAPDDYKPSITRLTDGTLLLTAFHQHKLEGDRVREDMLFFRSSDGGRTWSDPETPELLGREPSFTTLADGTLLITVHLLEQDVRNELGYTHSYLHRSTDGGKTWETMRIAADDVPGAPPSSWVLTSRNVLELEDGSLMLGVSAPRGHDYLWRSRDRGRTWDKSLASQFDQVDPAKLWWPFHAETLLWQARNGDLLAVARVDPRAFPALPGTEIPQEAGDQVERMMRFRSIDGGAHWRFEANMGTYGEMYPHLLRLFDGRLLLTLTVRSLQPSLGVQALLGDETSAGFRFDFSHDRLLVDAKTPEGVASGGGFGPTIQLLDGTLVTAYSYRANDGKTHLETVRWMVPQTP